MCRARALVAANLLCSKRPSHTNGASARTALLHGNRLASTSTCTSDPPLPGSQEVQGAAGQHCHRAVQGLPALLHCSLLLAILLPPCQEVQGAAGQHRDCAVQSVPALPAPPQPHGVYRGEAGLYERSSCFAVCYFLGCAGAAMWGPFMWATHCMLLRSSDGCRSGAY